MDLRTAHALARFGLGPAGAETPPDDPAAWLLNQLRQPDAPAAALDVAPPSTAVGLAAMRADREARVAARQNRASDTMPPNGDPAQRTGQPGTGQPGTGQPGTGPPAPERESRSRALYRAQGLAAITRAVTTTTPFRERLVWFWTNHFTVSLRRPPCAALAGAFVEEAIRPHVTGRFSDMLRAVMRHPAMLIYLDNAGSVGPNSPGGLRSHRGLNENLARECLELHTVSPDAGYAQDDVTSFARILTGWSVEAKDDPTGFVFRPRVHEPGEHTLMGKRFPEGEAGGAEALRFLANHPATHRFLATKLARHFVADTPPPAAIGRIEGILRDTGGDLGQAAAGLVDLEDAWTPGTKLRAPVDLVVAGFRALAVPPGEWTDPAPPFLAILAGLGQPLWTAPAPNGWPDEASAWSGPEAMMRRIDWAFAVSGRIGDRDPMEIADAALGPLSRPETRNAMAHAGSRREALTMLLTSPEFQRR
jgi:uncharacterized protein (DUF1800 family)